MTNWNLKEIHPEFTLKLQSKWEDKGFSEEEVKNWIKAGVWEWDSDFAHWLKEEKKCTADWVRDSGNIEELRKEYKEWWIEKTFFKIEAEVEKKEYQVSESEWADYWNELRKVTTDDARWKIKVKFFKQKSLELFTKKLAGKSPILIELINIEANYYTGEDAPYYDEVDYWKTWLNNSHNYVDLWINEDAIKNLLKDYEDEEDLQKAAAKRYYEVLGLPEEASIEEVKGAYKKLSREKHPDRKGGKRKEFNIINNAHEILGDEDRKAKYDLCLLKDKNWEDINNMYLNRKRWIRFTKSKIRVDDYFGRRIEFILQRELELNDLTEETISNYSKIWEEEEFSEFHHKETGIARYDEKLAQRVHENYSEFSEPEKGLMKAREFYVKKISGKLQSEAIEDARKYLEIIEYAIEVKERLEKRVEKSIKWGEKYFSRLFDEAKLSEEELSELGQFNTSKNVIKKYKELLLKKELKIADEEWKDSMDFVNKIKDKVDDTKQAKVKLLAEVKQEISKGEELLDKSEDISQFSTQFNDFLTLLRTTENYPVEIEKTVEGGEEEAEWSDEGVAETMTKIGKPKKIIFKYKTINENVMVNQAVIKRVLEEEAEKISSLEVKLKGELVKRDNTPSWKAFYSWLQKWVINSEGELAKIKPEKQSQYGQISTQTFTNFCDSLEATLDNNNKLHLFPTFDQNKSFEELFPYEKALFGKKTSREVPSRDEYNLLTELFKEFVNQIATTKDKESPGELTETPASELPKLFSKEEKQVIIEYLDNLVFEAFFKRDGKITVLKDKPNLTKAQNNIIQNYENSAGTKDYSVDINETDSKEKIKKIRERVVGEVIYYVGNLKGGGGEPAEVAEISANFANLVEKEKNQEYEIKTETKESTEEKPTLKKIVGKVISLKHKVNIFQEEKRLNEAKREIKEKEILAISEKELEEYYSLNVEDTEARENFLNDKLKEIENLKKQIEDNAKKWDEAYDSKENNHRVYQLLLETSKTLKSGIKKGLDEFSDNENYFKEKFRASRGNLESDITKLQALEEINWEKQLELKKKTEQLEKLNNLEEKWRKQDSNVKQITEKLDELDKKAKAEEAESDNFFKEHFKKLDDEKKLDFIDNLLVEKEKESEEVSSAEITNQTKIASLENKLLAANTEIEELKSSVGGLLAGVAEKDSAILAEAAKSPAPEVFLWKNVQNKLKKLLELGEEDRLPDDWENLLANKKRVETDKKIAESASRGVLEEALEKKETEFNEKLTPLTEENDKIKNLLGLTNDLTEATIKNRLIEVLGVDNLNINTVSSQLGGKKPITVLLKEKDDKITSESEKRNAESEKVRKYEEGLKKYFKGAIPNNWETLLETKAEGIIKDAEKISDLDRELAEIKGKNETLKTDLTSEQEKTKTLTTEKSALEKTNKDLLEKNKELDAAARKQATLADARGHERDDAYKVREKALEEKTKAKKERDGALDNLAKYGVDNPTKIHDLEEEVKELLKVVGIHEDEKYRIHNLSEEIIRITENVNNLYNEKKLLEEEKSALTSRDGELTLKNIDLEKEKNKLEESINNKDSRARSAESKLATEQTTYHATKWELNGLKDKLHRIFKVKEGEKLKENWENDINEWKDTSTKYTTQFPDQNPADVKTKLTAAQGRVDKALHILNLKNGGQLDTLSAKQKLPNDKTLAQILAEAKNADNYQNQLAKKEEVIENLQKASDSWKKLAEDRKNDFDEWKSKNEELAKQLATLAAEKGDLERKLINLEENLKKIAGNLGLEDTSKLTEEILDEIRDGFEIYEKLEAVAGGVDLEHLADELAEEKTTLWEVKEKLENAIELVKKQNEELITKLNLENCENLEEIPDLSATNPQLNLTKLIKSYQRIVGDKVFNQDGSINEEKLAEYRTKIQFASSSPKKLTQEELLTSDEKEFLNLIPHPLRLSGKEKNEKEAKSNAESEKQISSVYERIRKLLYETISSKYSAEEKNKMNIYAIHFPHLQTHNVFRIWGFMQDILNLRGRVKELEQENELLKSDNPAELAKKEGYLPLNEAERELNKRIQNGEDLLGGKIFIRDRIKEFWKENGSEAGVKAKYPNLFGYLYKIRRFERDFSEKWREENEMEEDLKIVGIKKDWDVVDMFAKYEAERKNKLQKLGQAKNALLNELGIDIYDDEVNIATELQKWDKEKTVLAKQKIITDAENFFGLEAGKLATVNTDYAPTEGGIGDWINAYNNKDILNNKLQGQKRKINNLLDRKLTADLPTEWEKSLEEMKDKAQDYDILINNNNDLIKNGKIDQNEINKLKNKGGISQTDYNNLKDNYDQADHERTDLNLYYNNIKKWLNIDKNYNSVDQNRANPIEQNQLKPFIEAKDQVDKYKNKLKRLLGNVAVGSDDNWDIRIKDIKNGLDTKINTLNNQIATVRNELNINPTITDNVNNPLQNADLKTFARAQNDLTQEQTDHNTTRDQLTAANTAKDTANATLQTWKDKFGTDDASQVDTKLKEAERDRNQYQSDLTTERANHANIKNKVNGYENYLKNKLGITDLTNLPPNTGKSLIELINYAKKDCHVPAHADYNNRHNESNKYRRIFTKLDGKVSDNELDDLLNNTPGNLQAQLNQEKQARQQNQQKLEEKEKSCKEEHKKLLKEKEQEIIQKLNTDLELKLTNGSTLETAISKIKELLRNPANLISIKSLQNQLKQANQTIADLSGELTQKLKNVKQTSLQVIEKLVPKEAYQTFAKKVENLTNYQDIKKLEQATLSQHLVNKSDCQEKKAQLISQQKTERIIFGSLLIVALLTIGGLIYKLKTSKRINKK